MARILTQAAIEKLPSPTSRREIPDGLVAGLYLIHQPSGARSWAVRFRHAGKPVKLTIGSYPTIPLAKARELGRDAILAAKQGRNPVDERKAERRKAEVAAADTLAAVCEEYLGREAKRLRSIDQRRVILQRLILPTLGKVQIDAIRRTDIIRLLDKIEDERGPRMADYALACLRRVMNWHAARSDDYRSPIVRGMARHKNKARERTLTDDELRAVWTAAGQFEGPFGAFVKFLLLTACRRTEASALRWNELVGTDWGLPATRNKVKVDLVRPLSGAARALLAAQPRIGQSDYVFTTGEKPLQSFDENKKRLDAVCGVTGWTLHDLRRTSRSLMSRAGIASDHAERCLGHKLTGVRGTYDRHEFHREKQLAFEALAAQIERIVHPQDNVVAVRGRRR